MYKSENDFSKILSSFHAAGIKKNRLNVLICPEELHERAETLMGTCLTAEAPRQQNHQQHHQDLVMLDCNALDVGAALMLQSMESALRSTCKMAFNEKKSGLNLLGLCASHLLAHENNLDCIALEDAWEDLISTTDMPVSLICPYMWRPDIPESRLEQNHNHGMRYL